MIPLLRRMKSRLVLANVSRPRLPSMTMSPSAGASSSTIVGAPRALDERLAVHDALEDPVRVRADLVVAGGEGDRRVHDGHSGGPSRVDDLAGCWPACRCWSITSDTAAVQHAALGREVVLVLDQDHCGGARVNGHVSLLKVGACVQRLCLLVGEQHPDQESVALRGFQRESCTSSRHHVDGQLRARPVHELREGHPHPDAPRVLASKQWCV